MILFCPSGIKYLLRKYLRYDFGGEVPSQTVFQSTLIIIFIILHPCHPCFPYLYIGFIYIYIYIRIFIHMPSMPYIPYTNHPYIILIFIHIWYNSHMKWNYPIYQYIGDVKIHIPYVCINYSISLTWIVRPKNGDDSPKINHDSRVREDSEVVIIYPYFNCF